MGRRFARRILLAMFSVVAVCLLLPPGVADVCVATRSDGATNLQQQDVALALPGTSSEYYVVNQNQLDNFDCMRGVLCAVNPFVYQETNGIPGLQRDDVYVKDQTCGAPSDFEIL